MLQKLLFFVHTNLFSYNETLFVITIQKIINGFIIYVIINSYIIFHVYKATS